MRRIALAVVALLLLFATIHTTQCKPSMEQKDNKKIDCRIRSGVELLIKVGELQKHLPIDSWDFVVLQIKSRSTEKIRQTKSCFYIKGETDIFCSILNIYNEKSLNDEYQIETINQTNNKVVWRYKGWFQPKKNLLGCFKDFTVRGIKISSPVTLENKWELSWKHMYWLDVFSPTYNVYVDGKLIKENIGSRQVCEEGICKKKLDVNVLNYCEEHEFCIGLKFNLNIDEKNIYRDRKPVETCTVLNTLCNSR